MILTYRYFNLISLCYIEKKREKRRNKKMLRKKTEKLAYTSWRKSSIKTKKKG